MPKKMKVNNIELQGNLFLAPMAGVSEVGFRHMASKFGAAATVTEMVSAKALLHQSKKTEELLHTAELPHTKRVVQIFGHEPQVMAEACLHPALEKFDWIDINMGCPANKIIKNSDGSALMKKPHLAKEIIEACAKMSQKPISVKIRKGFGISDDTAVDFAKTCQDAGASLITVHGRTSEQGYSGVVDLDVIARVKAAVSVPVVGNGDVTDWKSYERMKQTGVDGIMIGRGAMGKPWLFATLQGNEIEMNKFDVIAEHVEVLRRFHTDKWIAINAKKHFLWSLNGMVGNAELKRNIATCDDLNEVLNLLKIALQ